jgi:ketosteroid isomerase-like protein
LPQRKDTADPKIDQQIRMLAIKYDATFNNYKAVAIAALYTEDGVNAFHQTSHGRQAIEKSYAYDFQR